MKRFFSKSLAATKVLAVIVLYAFLQTSAAWGQAVQIPAGFVPLNQVLVPEPPNLFQFVKAITFGFGRMPAFQDKLMSRERWNLVNFFRTRQ